MEYESMPSKQIEQWAAAIQARGLADLAIPFLDVLQIWGFVGGQILWMLAPFVGENTLAPFAEALEEPETLRELQRYLREGEVQ